MEWDVFDNDDIGICSPQTFLSQIIFILYEMGHENVNLLYAPIKKKKKKNLLSFGL